MRTEERLPADFSWISLFSLAAPAPAGFEAILRRTRRASPDFYHVFLNRHRPRERLRDSRSLDAQRLQQGREILALRRSLHGPAQLHDSRLRRAPLARPGEAQIPAQRRKFQLR